MVDTYIYAERHVGMSSLFVGNRRLFYQTISLALDGLMLGVLKEAEGIPNRLMKMMLPLLNERKLLL